VSLSSVAREWARRVRVRANVLSLIWSAARSASMGWSTTNDRVGVPLYTPNPQPIWHKTCQSPRDTSRHQSSYRWCNISTGALIPAVEFAVGWADAGASMGTKVVMLLMVSTAFLGACSQPASARPREGAPVGVASPAIRNDGTLVSLPTLVPVIALQVTPVPSPLPEPGPPSPTMTPTHIIAATGGVAVNMRAGPSMAAPVIMTLREGALVEALGDPISAEGREWRPIRSGDRDGWVVAVVVRQR
jgi:hypothetical protein